VKISHRRRTTLADLTPHISTNEEINLWHFLYFMCTTGSKTDWTAFFTHWHYSAKQYAHAGSSAIRPKTMQQLQRYHDLVVKAKLSQTHAGVGMPLQAGQQQQQQQQHYQYAGGIDSTAAAAAAAAGSGMFGGGFDFSQLPHFPQPQMFMGGSMAGMQYMPGSMAGLYGIHAASMGPAAAAAAGGGGYGGLWGNQSSGAGYDPMAAAAARANWAAGRQQRGQPKQQTTRQHRKHRCNKCWRELAGHKGEHKNGKNDWGQGLRCSGNCATCNRPMADHRDDPCPAPADQQ
jgi:hypothetical protein